MPVPVAGAWQPLFNGKDLTGWTGDTSRWLVEDSKLKTNPTDNVGQWLLTEKTFGDFTLKLQVYTAGNTGLRLESDSSHLGIEIGANTTGNKTGQFQTGDQKPRDATANVFRPREWNDFEIIRRGSMVTLSINGQQINTADEKTLPDLARLTGPVKIGLESHSGSTSFRDIEIREIDRSTLKQRP